MSVGPIHPASHVRVRFETPDDVAAIRTVNEAAFGRPLEAKIVDTLRAAGVVTLSMVAVIGAEETGDGVEDEAGATLSTWGGEGGGWGRSLPGGEGQIDPGALPARGHGPAPGRVVGGEVIGHALVTPVVLDTGQGESRLLGLGPVAVLPEHQRQGVGTLLVEACLEHLRDSDMAGVVVVGDPGYYARFGFISGARWGLSWEVEAGGGVFMALELSPGRLAGKRGTVRYRPEFTV